VAWSRNPSWSPDGRWIVFEKSLNGGETKLMKLRVSDGRLVELIGNRIYGNNPDW
jgi:Tol biopolymer transport system component